jgi:LCP family protein required for cell wall assembly
MVYYTSDNQFSLREIKDAPKKDFFKPNTAKISQLEKPRKKSLLRLRYAFLAFALIFVFSGGYFLYKTNATFDQMTGQQNSLLKSIAKIIPFSGNFFQVLPVEGGEVSPVDQIKNNELDRLNILLLGLRGVGDPNGGLLTDTMMVMSIKVDTGEVALISVPRDLYIEIPNTDHKGKINEAYANGMKSNDWKGGLEYSKSAIENVTGLEIHYVTSVDFEAFKEIIDTLGGITVYLEKPFSERYQFEEGSIELPAGKNFIDGDTALLYARARFSSSDFDRARRQQQILVGVKEKALSLGILSNPVKIISIMNALGNHVRTDAELWEIKDLAGIFSKVDTSNVKRKVFDTSEEGMLYQSHSATGQYILLPEGGNFDKIHETCSNIFNAS